MCTLIAAIGVFDDVDLLVAANRDERLDRPADPPRLHPQRPLSVVAPIDRQAGGTWWGLNAAGLFAGITNRFGTSPPDPGRRSRGHLVFTALDQRRPAEAAARIAALEPTAYNRFHLLLADRGGAELVFGDGERLWRRPLGPGIHVLTERSLGAGGAEREAWLRERLAGWAAADRAPAVAELRRLLAFHHPDDPFAGTCVHAPWLGYGTRSSSLLRLGRDPAAGRLECSDGPPCRRGYADRSDLLRALFAAG